MALNHPADALPPGTALGRYELLRVLGRGGFGVTYAARGFGRSGEMVAIKELFPMGLCLRGRDGKVYPAHDSDRRDLKAAVTMFRRESNVICDIRHPNLVRGIEWLDQNNTGYLVMAYASGKNLHEHLRSRGGDFQVSPATLAQLCRGILSALSALHQKGICHCDVKPDNIFLGVGFEPILIDLGSACLPVHKGGDSPVTYSMHYSAIEQIDPRYGNVGPWTDIYQFSAVLYRCLTGGKLPDSIDRVASATDPFVPLTEIVSVEEGYPHSFLAAIDSGLGRLPADRPKSVEQWRMNLEAALGQIAASGNGTKRKPNKARQVRTGPKPSSPVPSQKIKVDSVPPRKTSPESVDPLAKIGLALVGILGILVFLLLGKSCGG